MVFKVERAAGGEKVAYVRMFDGSVRVRERLHFGDGRDATITGLKVFEHGAAIDRPVVGAGQIGKLAGLRSVRTGDAIGTPPRPATKVFAPPMFEVAVVARDTGQTAALHAALAQLAEQDPLIDLRQESEQNEHVRVAVRRGAAGGHRSRRSPQTSASRSTSATTTTICIERLRGRWPAVRAHGSADEPVRRDPGPVASSPANPVPASRSPSTWSS